jgi:hypothetical protein
MSLLISAELIGEENFTKKINQLKEFREEAKRILVGNSALVAGLAQSRAPVMRGYLKRSLGWRWDKDDKSEMSVFIGTTHYPVPYAAAQEFEETFSHAGIGHYYKGGKKRTYTKSGEWGFLRKSLAEIFPKFKAELEATIKRFT